MRLHFLLRNVISVVTVQSTARFFRQYWTVETKLPLGVKVGLISIRWLSRASIEKNVLSLS